MTRPHPREAGFALLIVLWTLVLVALLFTMLAASARSDAQLAGNLRSAAALEAAADGAIATTMMALLRDSVPPFQPRGTDVTVVVASEAGLVNPNTAAPELLRAVLVRLGAEAGLSDRLAGAIVDWRTTGQTMGTHGAKAPQYRAAGLDYGPPGAPFETVGELGDVLGMTPALLAALTPHLTLSWDGPPDARQADPVVRAALRDIGAPASQGEPNTRVVRITATARRPDGARATRRAVVRLGATPDRRGWRVLRWETVG